MTNPAPKPHRFIGPLADRSAVHTACRELRNALADAGRKGPLNMRQERRADATHYRFAGDCAPGVYDILIRRVGAGCVASCSTRTRGGIVRHWYVVRVPNLPR